jgi:hypothetical protein
MRLYHGSVCIWKYVYFIELHLGSDIARFSTNKQRKIHIACVREPLKTAQISQFMHIQIAASRILLNTIHIEFFR